MNKIETTVVSVKQNTDDILSLMRHGKSALGFVQKHGPRIIAFGVGIAATKGFMGHDVANFITGFFVPGS